MNSAGPWWPGVTGDRETRMKKILLALAAGAMALTASAAMAQDKLTLQLKWVTQA